MTRLRGFTLKLAFLGWIRCHSWLLLILLFFSSCNPLPWIENRTYLTPIPKETLQAYRFNQPVRNRLQAVIAAHYAIQTTRMQAVDETSVIFAEKMSYQEATNRINQNGIERSADTDFLGMDVWLVVFKGNWELTDPAGKIMASSGSCAFAVVDAENGDSVFMGLKECEGLT